MSREGPTGASPTAATIDKHFRLAQSVPEARQGLRKPHSLTRRRSCTSLQSGSCSERFVVPYEATGQTLRMQLELEELEHVRIEKVEQLFLDVLSRPDDSCRYFITAFVKLIKINCHYWLFVTIFTASPLSCRLSIASFKAYKQSCGKRNSRSPGLLITRKL